MFKGKHITVRVHRENKEWHIRSNISSVTLGKIRLHRVLKKFAFLPSANIVLYEGSMDEISKFLTEINLRLKNESDKEPA